MTASADVCEWCGGRAVSRVQIKRGKLPVWAFVCLTHEAHFEAVDGLISERRKPEIAAEKKRQRVAAAQTWWRNRQ